MNINKKVSEVSIKKDISKNIKQQEKIVVTSTEKKRPQTTKSDIFNTSEFSENDELKTLKMKYLDMKKERFNMEKEVDILENKIKVLEVEDDKAKKNILREIKSREDNLKIINEIANQKNLLLQAKIEQNDNLKQNIGKMTKIRENIKNTLVNYRNEVALRNKKAHEEANKQRKLDEKLKNTIFSEERDAKMKIAKKIKVQKNKAQKDKAKDSIEKKETMKKELIKLLEEESNYKKSLLNKIDTFSNKSHELKAKLIETKILDLNSKSMIELGKFD
jgi:hypothetical protein